MLFHILFLFFNKMNFKIILILLLTPFTVFSNTVCYIAVNTGDCSLCLNSYQYISKIDKKLNPIIVFSESDKENVDFFLNEYLQITNIEYVVDESKYNELVENRFNLMTKLYYDSTLLIKFPTKELSNKIDQLNNYNKLLLNKSIKSNSFNLTSLSFYYKKYLFGPSQRYLINNYLSLYNELTRTTVFTNLKDNKAYKYKLNDSFIYSNCYTNIQIQEAKKNRDFYKKSIEKLTESHVLSFGYYKNKFYLVCDVIDYKSLKSQEYVDKNPNEEISLVYDYFLIEFNVKDSQFAKNRIQKITEEDSKYDFRMGFSIAENRPALFFKDKDKNSNYAYYLLDTTWNKRNSLQKQPNLMSKYILESVFVNNYTFSYDKYNLINNVNGNYLKVIEGDYDVNLNIVAGGSVLVVKNYVYIPILDRSKKTNTIYKINVTNKEIIKIKELTELNKFNFFPFLYHDNILNLVYIIDVNDEKDFYIVDKINL